MTLKIPPYGKPLKALLDNQTPPTNDVYVFIGNKAWDKAKNSSLMRPTRTLCLPPDISPFSYDWPVQFCDILMVETGITDEELIKDLVSILFQSKAVIVRYINKDGILTVFKRI